MFQFLVKQSSPALRRMKTLVSARTTNLAAGLATVIAFERVKQNYPTRWRDQYRGDLETWQKFKGALGGDQRPGFLTGTTFKSISYRMIGKGKGEIYLKGRWPNFQVQDMATLNGQAMFQAVNNQQRLSAPEAGWSASDESVRDLSVVLFKDFEYRPGWRSSSELVVAEESFKENTMDILADLGTIAAKYSVILKGKKSGVIAGRTGTEEALMVDSSGLKYIHRGFRYMIPGESFRSKAFGTRRFGMFQRRGSKYVSKDRFLIPPVSSEPVDVLMLKKKALGGADDVKLVWLKLNQYYEKILRKK